MKNFSFVLLIVSLLSACGGGGGGGSTNSATASICSPAKESGNPAGLYRGIFNNQDGMLAQDASMLVAPNGKIAILSENELAVGAINFNNNAGTFDYSIDLWLDLTTKERFSGGVDAVVPGQFIQIDGDLFFGVVDDRTQWDAQFSYTSPIKSTCLENSLIDGTWSNASNTLALTFSQDKSVATFLGASNDGCAISGRIDSFGIEGGIFSLDAVFENCSVAELNGEFSGLGALVSRDLKQADTVLMIMASDTARVSVVLGL